MERIRIRWAALVAALLLIVSMAGVAVATHLAQPSAVGAPHVQAAPAAEDEDQDADGTPTETATRMKAPTAPRASTVPLSRRPRTTRTALVARTTTTVAP